MDWSASRRRFGRCCCSAVLGTFAGCNALLDSNGETRSTTKTNGASKAHGTASKSERNEIPVYAVNHTDEKRDLSIVISGGKEVISKRFILEAGERKRISSVSSSNQPITAETRNGLKNSKPAKSGALSVTIDIRTDSIDIRSETLTERN
ncbi:hypothetical protein [Haladaptatus sp. W1]|uniref:hypothetical protein n=1 Tax=Haladaptatus sp. W1 TaxID=1897478 RepID=UPI0020C81F47|nr:hypothetical protein [Haladaptatus sp. W1]